MARFAHVCRAAALVGLTSPLPAMGADWKESVLHAFIGRNGADPEADIILDPAGNIYSTASEGGRFGSGLVFELARPQDGQRKWSETELHSFTGMIDGGSPTGGVVFDSAGVLYGTAFAGGQFGDGLVFALVPPTGRQKRGWTLKVIYAFDGHSAGAGPNYGVVFDPAGNLYGTASFGPNPSGYGMVFKLVPPTLGQTAWTENVLYSFSGGTDGADPYGGIILDQLGNIYGMTHDAGAFGQGTVFEISPPQPGQTSWTETVLYSFGGIENDPTKPIGGLTFDSLGNLYGSASQGGDDGFGATFELIPPQHKETNWTERTLYSFTGQGDGNLPTGKAIFDVAGNLYGTTLDGGAFGDGVVFSLTPPSSGTGSWKETVVYSFTEKRRDGRLPAAGVTFDQNGSLLGTTIDGGRDNTGTVFALTKRPP